MGKRSDREQRPELSRGIYDIKVGEEFASRPKQECIYVFLLDATKQSLENGLLEVSISSLEACISTLVERERCKIGICVYDNVLHFIQSHNGHIQETVMCDLEDPFAPLPSTSFLIDSKQQDSFTSIISHLRETYLHPTYIYEIGISMASLKAIAHVLEVTGGQVIIISGEASIMGNLAVNRTENPRTYGTLEESTLYLPSDNMATYEDLALYCVIHQICVHLCLLTAEHVHLAEMRRLAEVTGGTIYLIDDLLINRDYSISELHAYIQNIVLKYQVYEGVLKIRTSKELKFVDAYGGFSRGEDEIYVPVIDNDRCFYIKLDLPKYLYEKEQFVQCALLYLDIYGNRFLRVFNYKFRCTDNFTSMYRSMDLSSILLAISRDAVVSLPDANLVEIRDVIQEQVCKSFGSYRNHCSSSSPRGQLVLPETLKLLPLYINCLMKSSLLLLNDNTHSSLKDIHPRGDERTWAAHHINTCSMESLFDYLYPSLYELDPSKSWGNESNGLLEKPTPLFLTAASLNNQHIFLITGSMGITLLVGSQTPIEQLNDLFGIYDMNTLMSTPVFLTEYDNDFSFRVNRLIEDYQQRFAPYMVPRVVIRGTPAEIPYLEMLTEDRIRHDPSFAEFLCNLHRKIQEDYLD
ncbi:hypothetical protein WA158_002457 [Blastocystis sp. Blastoise]